LRKFSPLPLDVHVLARAEYSVETFADHSLGVKKDLIWIKGCLVK
jgi:hypothetical protein